jgi:hypothetical protein
MRCGKVRFTCARSLALRHRRCDVEQHAWPPAGRSAPKILDSCSHAEAHGELLVRWAKRAHLYATDRDSDSDERADAHARARRPLCTYVPYAATPEGSLAP